MTHDPDAMDMTTNRAPDRQSCLVLGDAQLEGS